MPIQVVKAEVFGFLEKTKQPQTIIFADPPYELEHEKFLKIVELVFQNKLVNILIERTVKGLFGPKL